MYTRRDNVIVTGFPETPNESVFEIFKNISSAINNSPLTSNDLSTKDSIKPIVLKFVRRQDKVTWLSDFKKTASQNKDGPGWHSN
ncbi:hypothetical protein LSTR_LSTR004147 [Laodelphax striatellus]|uniref:Uncharacterized protein n=1 Tax=Laodelphax striatellus TaxID=195883 RepID=A0A482X9J5_LAOST|nr:hypothetical protein LSTR_LSTR004147 [Laodelphax striatellus]